MNSFQSLLMAFEEKLNAEFTASVVVTGLTVVFLGLCLLVLFVWLLGKLFTVKKKPQVEKAPSVMEVKADEKPVISTVNVEAVDDGIPDEVVAVITAAVAAMSADSGKKMVVKSVAKSVNQRPAWSVAGLAENTRRF